MELGRETPLLLPHVFLDELEAIADCESRPEMLKGSAYEELKTAQEIVVTKHLLAIALRPSAGSWRYVKIDPETVNVKIVDTSSYLAVKEKLSSDSKQAGHQMSVLEALYTSQASTCKCVRPPAPMGPTGRCHQP